MPIGYVLTVVFFAVCTALALAPPFPMRSRGVDRLRNITYAYGPGHRLDVYRSRGDREGRPMLVYFHGGAFRSGDKARQARPLLQALALRGLVCVSVNYPLAPHANYSNQLAAARLAVSWASQRRPAVRGCT
jgi:acetyl esterase/lipase